MIRALLVLCTALVAAAPASALKLNLPGQSSSPAKVIVHRPSDTVAVVYDARPEMGIGMHDMGKPARDMVRALGIRMIRHTLYWNLMETTEKPGLYDSKYLTQWDKLVEDCRKEGICLQVVVHGDPPGVSFANRQAAYARFARFTADMAARYPSIIYWELFNEMDAGFTCLFGAKDSVPVRERGEQYAEMLKVVYLAVKSANPSAWVLCGGMVDTTDFPRGIYEGGGKSFFDIMSVHTYGVPVSSSFVERGKNIRKVMLEFGDENKPVWNTEFGLDAGNVVGAWGYPHDWKPAQEDGPAFDSKQLEDYQACWQKNAELHLFDKLLPYQFQAGNERDDDGAIKTKAQLPDGATIDDYGFGIVRRDMTPRPTYKWLLEKQLNAAIMARPRNTVNVVIPTKVTMIPVGYDYRQVEDGVEVQRVVVDSLVPTVIHLRYAPDPEATKPGTTPAPRKSRNPAPKPDYWDP